MEPQQKIIGITRTSHFIGDRKVGLDTNILIKLYNNPYLFGHEEARIFNYPNLIFIHVITKYEFIKYIVSGGFKEEDAKAKVNSFIREHNIQVIYSKDIYIPEEEIRKFEEQVNEKLRGLGREYLNCHKPDSIILLAFKKSNVNKIISTDEVFREGAKILKIDVEGLPSLSSKISKELKKFFDYKKRCKRFR
jgi:predicted nucleic acid-binding protein